MMGVTLISTLIFVALLIIVFQLELIARTLKVMANSPYFDDDPDYEDIPEEREVVNAESDIHLKGLKPRARVLPFRREA